MAISPSQCGAVILAGGQSRRMGACKALLPWQGQPLVSHLRQQLPPLDEIWLSANDAEIAAAAALPCVKDHYPDAGPLAGLHAALSASQKEFMLCVPCDQPHFCAELAALLMRRFPQQADAIVCRDGTGRLHPLCGIFRRSTLPILTRQLEQRSLRATAFLECISCTVLETADLVPDSLFDNLNTMADYRALDDRQ